MDFFLSIIIVYLPHIVAYVFEETLLPDSVVVSTDDGINLNLSCIGATGNTDITVNVFEVRPTNTSSYTFHSVSYTHLLLICLNNRFIAANL